MARGFNLITHHQTGPRVCRLLRNWGDGTPLQTPLNPKCKPRTKHQPDNPYGLISNVSPPPTGLCRNLSQEVLLMGARIYVFRHKTPPRPLGVPRLDVPEGI